MTQANVVDLNQSYSIIDLIDNASRLGKQAKAVLLVLTANDAFTSFEATNRDLLLWAVTDRLDDISALFNECSISELSLLKGNAAKLADQASSVIVGLQDNHMMKGLSDEVLSNALWFVSDRIDDILKLTSQIKVR